MVPLAPQQQQQATIQPVQPGKKASRLSGSHLFFYILAILQARPAVAHARPVCMQAGSRQPALPSTPQNVKRAAPLPLLQMLCAVALVVIVASRVEERSQLEDTADGLSVTYTVCEHHLRLFVAYSSFCKDG